MENIAKQLLSPSDHYIPHFETENKVIYIGIPIKIKTYGRALFTAPLIIINLGVTKSISEESYKNLDKAVGFYKPIDPDEYTIVELEIDSDSTYSFTNESYRNFSIKDMNSIINIAITQFDLPKPQLIYHIHI
jgi:hypothetical protein